MFLRLSFTARVSFQYLPLFTEHQSPNLRPEAVASHDASWSVISFEGLSKISSSLCVLCFANLDNAVIVELPRMDEFI